MELDFHTGLRLASPRLRIVDKGTGEIKSITPKKRWGKFKYSGFTELATRPQKLTMVEVRLLWYMMGIVKQGGMCYILQAKVASKLGLTSGRVAAALKGLVSKEILTRIDVKCFKLSYKYFEG